MLTDGKERTNRGTHLVRVPENHIPMKSPKKKAATKTATRKAVAKASAKTGGKVARPVAQKKKAARKAAAVTTAKPPVRHTATSTARKAAPAKKAMPRQARSGARSAAAAPPPARLREQQVPQQPLAEHLVHTPTDPQRPEATYDPTPDTNVPLRGHTSFQHNAQSERAAALKGQRARLGGRRKH